MEKKILIEPIEGGFVGEEYKSLKPVKKVDGDGGSTIWTDSTVIIK